MVDIIELKELKEKDISTLTDEELKDILMRLNDIQLSKLGEMSIYYSIFGCLDIIYHINKDNIFDKIQSQEEIQLLEKHFKSILKFLENLDERMISDDSELEELKVLRNNLEVLLTDLEPYIVETSYLDEKFNYYLIKKLINEQKEEFDIDEEMINNFVYQVMTFLMKDVDEYEVFVEKISLIITALPYRITKEKFFEIVTNTLRRDFSNYTSSLVEYEIKNYKRIFDGSMESSFGTCYDDYFRKVLELKKHKNLKSLTVEELGSYSQKTSILLSEMEDLDSLIKHMGIVVNKLISVSLIRTFDIDFCLDKNILELLNDYLKDTKEDYKKLKDALNHKTNKLENEMIKTNELFEKIIMESVNREDLIDEKLNEKMMITKKVLTYYNDFSFMSDEILFYDEEEDHVLDKDYLEEVLNNYIHFLNRSIRIMSNDERKLRMRRLLSSLKFPFEDPEDFTDYIESSLDFRITSKEEIVMAMKNINYMMNIDN
ncbi:hypothetical protein [Anaerosalibacter sp. Marseille-P3206]|uniref:hypothetical protein n=1 Tax=Anaerosalibacter sp. Marseille-P3206 TaxID=1871005 RepID=UPI0009879427|nr:hypothetical protein [Anaerosalibacter sp. Marseille-P3206]